MMKIIRIIKGWIDKIIFRIKLWEMDEWWYYTGGSCWGLFPPSFYYTHRGRDRMYRGRDQSEDTGSDRPAWGLKMVKVIIL